MKKYSTVIFDLDGTLLNTLEDLTDSVNYALSLYGYKERGIDEVRMFVGNGIRKLIERAVPPKTDVEIIDKVFAAFKQHYLNNMMNKTKPYDGIMTLLSELNKRGVAMAIVSNKYDQGVKGLNRHFFSDYIKVAIGESENIAKKPAPDTVYEAVRKLGINPEDAVYVGDSDVDIATAENSGLDCISVTWGFRDRTFLEEKGATVIIDEPCELLKFMI
ncbi:MAG: HAD family hydrolase [Coprococcus sp.]